MSDKLTKSPIKQVFMPVLVIGFLLFLWLVPSESYTMLGLTLVQQRVLLVFLFAVIMWVTEIIPPWITSVSLTTILLFTVSDNGLKLFHDVPSDQLLSSRQLIASFADPVIFLFLGGFVLAAVASKFHIDRRIANMVIKIIGTKSHYYLFGIMLVTGVCSMFVSNTATAIMMLTLISPILKEMDSSDKGQTALILGVSVSANLGGMGTPIGTPPNAIILKYLNDPTGLNMDISFGEWAMMFGPIAIILIIVSWFVIVKFFPFANPRMKLIPEDKLEVKANPIIKYSVYCIIGGTIALWCFDRFFGVDPNVVAFIPISLFCLLSVFVKDDLASIDWSVLWLVAGGFALGYSFQDSGLAYKMITSINFSSIAPWIIFLSCWLICWALSNFISNTATVNLLAPIFTVLAASLGPELAPLGGARTLLMGVAIFASLAMMLPVSTPPNALAYSTGHVSKRDMQKVGITIGALGLIFTICISLAFH
ncbi:SLC13 family permease [Bacteroides propionicifaciens]|uniref:SLC13 family permease n=1 Tax=Bacteroides propionicifaciens TaxID=392838 RepID=UPI0003A051AD|nr:SLC13 family permease [Bacteroides propionicifaciens]